MTMDRKIEKKPFSAARTGWIVVGLTVVVIAVFTLFFSSSASSVSVNADSVVIQEVEDGPFREFIDISGTIQPVRTTFLDAIEGGVVQRVFLESGTMVDQGDTILTLTNSSLQLNVLQQEAGLYDQINNVRNSRLNLEQNHLNLQKELASSRTMLQQFKSRYSRDSTLFNRELISEQEFEETKQNFEFQKMRYELTYESYQKDSLQMQQQLVQLNNSEDRMWRSLEGVQQIVDNLVVTAPISGQLSTVELDPGQSIQQGERIGQIDLMDGFKVRAGVDEFYLARIVNGLEGSFAFAGSDYDVRINRIFPVIQSGQFQIDMEFMNNVPDGLRRGQTVRVRLELGESTRATLLPRGSFFSQTGGNWVYLLDESGESAFKQTVRLGRSNGDYFEVLEGLQPGDRVITSSYITYDEKDILVLN